MPDRYGEDPQPEPDHPDFAYYQAAARRGMDMIRQALKDAKQRKENK
jgi:hypothetical protein